MASGSVPFRGALRRHELRPVRSRQALDRAMYCVLPASASTASTGRRGAPWFQATAVRHGRAPTAGRGVRPGDRSCPRPPPPPRPLACSPRRPLLAAAPVGHRAPSAAARPRPGRSPPASRRRVVTVANLRQVELGAGRPRGPSADEPVVDGRTRSLGDQAVNEQRKERAASRTPAARKAAAVRLRRRVSARHRRAPGCRCHRLVEAQ